MVRFRAVERSIHANGSDVGRFLDSLHTSMSIVANWKYLIQHFGDELETDFITWCAIYASPRRDPDFGDQSAGVSV